jgi:hypothetical protein
MAGISSKAALRLENKYKCHLPGGSPHPTIKRLICLKKEILLKTKMKISLQTYRRIYLLTCKLFFRTSHILLVRLVQ